MRETNAMDERNDTWFVQSDWTRALGGDVKLETGAKGTYRRMTSDFAVANALPSAEALAPDLGRSNAFVYDEHVSAVYGVLSRRTGKVNVQGGLRYEVADTRFDLRTTRERFDNDYRSLFPSALVSYDLDAQRQVKLSYSKRINRPVVQQLNPFGFREDQYNIFAGNPGLRPEYTHALELGWQQSVGKGSLQLTPFFRHTTDAVRQIGTVGSDSILRVGFRNAATSDQYGADANLSLRAGAFSGFGGASVFEQVTDASNLAGAGGAIATAGRVRAFGWSARGNVTWKVTPRLDLQSFAMYRAGMRTEQGRISHFTLANVALRQKLRGDRATMTLRVMDPFGTMGWAVRASDGRVLQAMERQFGARGAFLNFGYTFGRPPKIRQRPQEQDQPAGGQPGIPG
jgi:outer membrane receptor protein involved in Fe transport